MAAKFDMAKVKPIWAIEGLLLALLIFVGVKSGLPLLKQLKPNATITADGGQNTDEPNTGNKPVLPVVSNKPKVDNSILSKFDPFHRDAKPSDRPELPAGSAPETTLDLKVFGMRAVSGEAEGKSSSSAIIETPDGKQKTYFVGDEIIDDVTLQSVDVDYVILDRDGTQERLSRQGKAEGDAGKKPTQTQKAYSFKAQHMINDVRFYSHRENREIIGYRVHASRGAKLEKYGFKKNDIVTSINGENMTGRRVNLQNIWKNLRLARYATIQIIRDDMPSTIEVNLL